MATYGSILELVGATPLCPLARIPSAGGARILVKCEQFEPGGSVKDRICLGMIEAAEKAGRIGPGTTLVEPTSGNTGIGLALVCAVRGYRLVLTMPESMSLERRSLLEAYGAEIVLTPAEDSMQGAIEKARALAAEHPNWFMPQQFENLANPAAHRETTAREILAAMGDEAIDAFVAGVGTGGTITGVGGALKAHRASTRVVAVEPETSAVLSGHEAGPTKIQGLAAGFVPQILDTSVYDEVRTVGDRAAYDMKTRLAHEEGMLVGMSAGAAVSVAADVARELGPGKTVVTVLPDTGERYFSLDEYFR